MLIQDKNSNLKYDLVERIVSFSENILLFLQKINTDKVSIVLINQLTRSATSIGANYMEANSATSKKDFLNKIAIWRKEAKETTYWLRLLAKTTPEEKDTLRKFWKESHESLFIFSKIVLNSKIKN